MKYSLSICFYQGNLSGITVEKFSGLLRNFYYMACEDLCKRMTEFLVYAGSQDFDRMCDDDDFTSVNVPSDYLSLLVALRLDSAANTPRLDVDAMR